MDLRYKFARLTTQYVSAAGNPNRFHRFFQVAQDAIAADIELTKWNLKRLSMGRDGERGSLLAVELDKYTQREGSEIIDIYNKNGVGIPECRSCRPDCSEWFLFPKNFEPRAAGFGESAAGTIHVLTNSRFGIAYGDNNVVETFGQKCSQVSFDQRNAAHGNQSLMLRSCRRPHPLRASAGHDQGSAISKHRHNSLRRLPFLSRRQTLLPKDGHAVPLPQYRGLD